MVICTAQLPVEQQDAQHDWAVCRVAMLEEELGRMNPDMSAIAAFQAKEAEYAQRVTDLEAATAERDNVSWH